VLTLRRRRFLLSVVVAAAGVCAPGCGRRDAPQNGPMTMRVGIGAPPKGMRDTGAGAIINLLKGDPWLTNKADGRPGERIATGWTWDESGTVLRLKLRRDVYFHDNTLLTPALAAQSLRAATNADSGQFSFQSVTSIEPEGDDTLVLRLKERNAFVVPDLTAVLAVKAENRNIGTGPFQLVSSENKDAKLTAFGRYYRGQPALAGIEVTNYPTQRNAWAALMRGDIDMLYEVSRDAAEFVEAESTVKTYSFPRPYYIPLVFNVRRPVLRDAQVRQAINEAVDRLTLVRDGLRGRGTTADGPVSPQNWAYSPPAAPFTYVPDSARRRLDSAGYPARRQGQSAVPIRFKFECLVFADDSRFDRLALLVQKQLADVGIDMQLVPLGLSDFGERVKAGEFDAFLMEMSGRSLSRVYEFWRSHDGIVNKSGYSAADSVLDRVRAARTDDEVRAGVAELGRVMHDDPPAAFLVWPEMSRAALTKFDVAGEPNRDILTNLWMWRPAAASRQAPQ
jgi:peptide/nickel transport system substrate-binding protein